MNFSLFEKQNLGFYLTTKDIHIDEGWIKASQVVEIKDIRVFFWRVQWDLPTYKIDIELMLFGGEEKTITLYFEPKNIEDLNKYFNSIFQKIKITS